MAEYAHLSSLLEARLLPKARSESRRLLSWRMTPSASPVGLSQAVANNSAHASTAPSKASDAVNSALDHSGPTTVDKL